MNNQKLAEKVRQDVANVKKDISTLEGDYAAQIGRFESEVSKVAENLTSWVEDGVSQLGEGFEKLADDAKETVVNSAEAVKKDVGQGLSQYNAKAQEVANKVPGDIGKKAAKYPWVAITIALVVGFMLGSAFNHPRGPVSVR